MRSVRGAGCGGSKGRLRPALRAGAGGDILVRAGTFDAVGDGNPVPGRAGCPRPEGHAPGRVECPRQCWWQGRRWWADDDAAVRRRCWARAAPELTSKPPRRQFPLIPRESQEDIEAAGESAEAGSATPSRARPNGARWRGRRPLSVSRTRRGALSAPDLPDITQVTARNRLKMPQIPRRDL